MLGRSALCQVSNNTRGKWINDVFRTSVPIQLRQSSYSTLPFILLQRATVPPSAHYRAGHTSLHIYTIPGFIPVTISLSLNTKIYITLIYYMRLSGFIPTYEYNAKTILSRLHAGLLIQCKYNTMWDKINTIIHTIIQ